MRHLFNKTLLVTSIVLALGSQAAFATNGLAPTGVGQIHKTMGGAAAGYAANTMSMATNPASASFVNDGYDVGVELFKPNRSATSTSALAGMGVATGTKFDGNGKEMFLIPEGGYKKQINEKVAAGVVVYGNGGMNTSYDVNPFAAFGSSGTAGVDLQQLFISPTVSYKLSDKAAVGVSANMVYQKFKAEGLQGFQAMSVSGANVTNNGYDSSTGLGATIGVQGKLSDKLSAGLSYRSKVKMGKLDKYKGLFPNQGEMNVPAAITAGIAYQATPKTLVAADVQQIQYSDVAAIGNRVNAGALGATGGAGFGWTDQTIYKVGVKHQLNDNLALMAGYNHGKSPVGGEDTTFNVVAPGVVEDHISLGFEKKLTPKSKLIGSYVHAFKNEVKGNATNPQLDAYNLKMEQDAIGISYSREF
jgi:long-chain fatty acid transport protein